MFFDGSPTKAQDRRPETSRPHLLIPLFMVHHQPVARTLLSQEELSPARVSSYPVMRPSQKMQWFTWSWAHVRSAHSCSLLIFTTTAHNRYPYSTHLTDETKPHGDRRTCPESHSHVAQTQYWIPGQVALMTHSASSFLSLAYPPVFITPSQLAFSTAVLHLPCLPHPPRPVRVLPLTDASYI